MSTVLEITKPWSFPTSESDVSGRRATEVYDVLFDEPGVNLESIAKTATGIPRVQVDTHPEDDYIVATRVSTTMVSPFLVRVMVEYGLPEVAGFRTIPSAVGGDYIDWRPEVSWDVIESEEEVDHDVDGDIITNTNGEILRVVRRFADPVLTVVRNMPSFSEGTMVTYTGEGGATNSDVFNGTLPGQACIRRIRPTQVYHGPYEYVRVEFQIAFRKGLPGYEDKAWYRRHANRGFLVRPSAGASLERAKVIASEDYEPQPILLAENGTRVENPANTHWLYTQVFPSLPFAALGIL